MALCKMNKLMKKAKEKKQGIGAFSVGNMEMVIGVIKAAEEMNTPVILQIAEVRLTHSPLALMAPMMVEAAKKSKVDVAVHLDHGLSVDVIKQALEYGFTSVMFDGSRLPFKDNIAQTKEVVAMAEHYGATVEAELGLVGGSEDGKTDHGIRCTNPQDAKFFCEQTKVDALAIAIGNAHGDYPVAPTLEFQMLKEIDEVTEIPLVLHGGSGITNDDFQKAITFGIVKINIATASFNSLVKKTEEYIRETPKHNFFDLNLAMVEGVYENVKEHIKVFNCNKKETIR